MIDDLEYLKHVGCPRCMSKKTKEKAMEYTGCENECNTVVEIDQDGNRQWRIIPWQVKKKEMGKGG